MRDTAYTYTNKGNMKMAYRAMTCPNPLNSPAPSQGQEKFQKFPIYILLGLTALDDIHIY